MELTNNELLIGMAICVFAVLAILFNLILGKKGLKAWLLFAIGVIMFGGSMYITCATQAAQCGWDWGNPGTWLGWFPCNIGAAASAVQLGQACIFFKIGLLVLAFVAFIMGLWRVFT